ncbi:hypothetical protein E8E14_005346 [Neopestalotiopsis sp. 37M]|nr:hypothetical protein E8E14_005346 [Neopestalotiopsis sp. 37M]
MSYISTALVRSHRISYASSTNNMAASSVTVIFSPYHVGLRDHRVGDGPNRIRQFGIVEQLESLGLTVKCIEIPPVDDLEGEIGRSFEILRRTSTAVSNAKKDNSFPLVLSGNCMATVGVACGLNLKDPGFIYFDAHDDMDTPSTNTNGYFDAMGLSMLAGKSWHTHTETIPGYSATAYNKFIYCGLRDVSDVQRDTVEKAGCDVIWGNASNKIDFTKELSHALDKKSYSPALVHLDLDVLDEEVGKVNGFESRGGLTEDDLVQCMDLVPKKAAPKSLTVCSFNPNLGDGDKVAAIGVRAAVTFFKALIETSAVTTK